MEKIKFNDQLGKKYQNIVGLSDEPMGFVKSEVPSVGWWEKNNIWVIEYANEESLIHDVDDQYQNTAHSLYIWQWNMLTSFSIKIYYFKLVDITNEGSVEVVESMNGIHKPVQISNHDFDSEFSIELDFPDSYETGNVSFSVLRESIVGDTVLITLTGTSGTMVLTLENNDLYNGTYATKTSLAENILKQDVWQKFVIFFNISKGCQIFVDGVSTTEPDEYIDFSTGPPTDLNTVKIETVFNSGEDYSFWFDSFLLEEIIGGFMIDVYNTSYIYLRNLKYSFDGGVKKSFTNEELFSFPEDGLHDIIIYGTDAYGDEYQSEFKIFTTGESFDIIETSTQEYHEMPTQWSDYSHTYGTNGITGSTEYNDGSEIATVNAAVIYGAETYLGYIIPNGNINPYTYWDEADSGHYSDLNEYPDTNGDGLNIRESTAGRKDRWNFNSLTLPANSIVSKLIVYMYCLHEYITEDQRTMISMTSNIGASGFFGGGNAVYTWESDTTTGLSLSQGQLDGLYINVEPYNIPFGENCYVDIETVYIKVYYKTVTYRLTTEVTFTIPSADLASIDMFYYDYATTSSLDCDLDIWNYVLDTYTQLESNTGTGWITDSYDFSVEGGNDYIESSQIKIRFETVSGYANDFDLQLDQLMISYKKYIYTPKIL